MTLSGHASPLAIVVVTMVWTVIAVIAVLLRLYCRLAIAKNPGLDDALLAIGACLAIGLQVGTCLQGTIPVFWSRLLLLHATDHCASTIRLGSTWLVFDTGTDRAVTEDLLCLHCHLLWCHVLHQGVHLRTVLSHISTDVVQMAMQIFNALHLRLVALVNLRWTVSMSSGPCGVGTVDTWC